MIQDRLLIAVWAAACVLLAGQALRMMLLDPFDVAEPRRERSEREGVALVDGLFERLGRPLAGLVGRYGRAGVERRIKAAGGLGGLTVDRFMARRAGGIMIGGGTWVGYLNSGHPWVGLLVAGILAYQTDYRLSGAAKRRQDEIQRALPDLLDVLSVTIMAGASFRVGLARVCQSLPGPLADELTDVHRQMDIGVGRRRAFEQLRERNPAPGLHRLVAGVLRAEELGHSLSDSLVALADEMRSTGTQDARRRADSTDKAISMVTTVLLLPAMVLLVLAVFFGGIRGAT